MRPRSFLPPRFLALAALTSLVLSGCSGCSRKPAGGVALSEPVAVRVEPNGKAGSLTTLSLAEQVQWLGDSVVDAGNPKRSFLKVRLADGKEGWVNAWQLAAPAQAAVLLERTALYKRPDQATVTGKSLPAGELVARLGREESGDWVEVVTMNRSLRGWTLRPSLSGDPAELRAATAVRKARLMRDPARRAAALQALPADPAVASSRVWEALKDSLAPAVAAPAPEPAPADTSAVPPGQ